MATDSLTVFFTGSTLGRLKPCGCSGGQLGGLARRPAVFDTVPVDKRMLIDTGALVESDRDQDLIKFDIIVEALGLLDYNAVNLTEDDFEMARNRGLLGQPDLWFISPHGTGDEAGVGLQNRYMLNGEYVTISVVTFDVDRSPMEHIKQGFVPVEQGDKTVNILIVSRCDEDIVSSIAALDVVDCIVCPSEAEDPMIFGSKYRRPLVVSVGRYGRHICRLKIEKARVRDRFKFQFTWIRVEENLKQDPTLKELYKGYQQIVKDSKLLEKHPRYPLDDGLKYVGSESCKACHEPAYEKWQETGHARAYATLENEKLGYQFDPECVLCHVVGLDYESGFVSEQETPEMKNVGCENCHGPGSEHVEIPIQAKTKGPKSTCLDCHTPEHSGEYAGNERSFRQKIIHWTEPNTPGNVK
ncbi:MAG: cytochrome c family protein [Phycisphaerales bacterium]|nr:MAG: cytochrome c family protein [Phycisphaerales bacterium]